jgi:hypothetical protein
MNHSFRKHSEGITFKNKCIWSESRKANEFEELANKRPEMFNSLPKTSCCHVEVDIHGDSIMNKWTQGLDALSSVSHLFESQKSNNTFSTIDRGAGKSAMPCFEPKLTRPLKNWFEDEEARRLFFKISNPVEVPMSLHKNIDVNPFALDIQVLNTLENEPNLGLTRSFIQSGSIESAGVHSQSSYDSNKSYTLELTLNQHLIQNFNSTLLQNKVTTLRTFFLKVNRMRSNQKSITGTASILAGASSLERCSLNTWTKKKRTMTRKSKRTYGTSSMPTS